MRMQHDLREAIDHLPEASVLTVDGVSWEEYEQLLYGLEDRRGIRVSYDCGRLDIVTTSRSHEWRKEFLLLLIGFLCDELKTPMQSFGQTTWKQKRLLKGAEADTCFYAANAPRIIHKKDHVDLAVDPPPDVVVEIDVSSQSDRKFAIYAAFGVPEIWRLKAGTMQFFELQDGKYVETQASRGFPILTSAVVTRFMKQCESEDQMAVLNEFRQWVRKQETK